MVSSDVAYIYGLTEPGQIWNIRYIGRTIQPLEKRLRQHTSPSALRVDDYRTRWIKSLLQSGLKPEIVLLDIGTEETCGYLEQFHIDSHKEAGFHLTNTAPGGLGGS